MSRNLVTRTLLITLAGLLTTATGCAIEEPGDASLALEDGTPEAAGVLAMLNHRAMTLVVLDDRVGLDRRAAANLVAHRDGPDGVLGTADDDLYGSIVEVDEVGYVGATAIQKLLDYAIAHGWVEPEADVVGVYDDVPFSASEISAVLDLVDTATQLLLDDEVGLDSRAAAAIVAARPLLTMVDLSACSYVGQTAMQKLKSYALAHGYGDPAAPDAPLPVSITALTLEAETHGTGSQYFGKRVTISRAIVTSGPNSSTSGVWFWVADPWVGNTAQLEVYLPAGAEFDTGFLSIFDDVTLTATFTASGSTFEILFDDPDLHALTLRKSGLAFAGYRTVQAAWHTTAANPEGVVRVVSTSGNTFMVPMPIFLDHPMWNGTPPPPPQNSGNEQDYTWNQTAQAALDSWR